jgi:2-phospho-L-lactate transferase/gluconeogenesis factor (CofD/UPF0052 family)
VPPRSACAPSPVAGGGYWRRHGPFYAAAGIARHVAVPGGFRRDCDPCLITDLAALVTVTDDGGSSGRLRKGFNMLPPGDLRNCMVALSEEEDLLAQLFRHRFKSGGDMEGITSAISLSRR